MQPRVHFLAHLCIYLFMQCYIVSDYVLLLSDLDQCLGVKQHPHDQLDHDQTPKHGLTPDHGIENHSPVQLHHGHQPQNCLWAQ